ncbi:MAG: NAD+ synthase, partial [Micromonosporaceae bacterium]
GNAALVREWTRRAVAQHADLVAFPEMMLTGYPPEDLVFREAFTAASRAACQQLAEDLAVDGCGECPVAVGFLDADGPARLGADAPADCGPRDALALLHRGRVVTTYYKHHLPNYGVFDEDRYFVPGRALTVARIGGVDVAFTICEDIWQPGGPFSVAGQAQVGLVVNINGSPYELNKDDVRLPLVQRRAAEAGAAVAYVNMCGGQDELVFDGASIVVSAEGALLARAAQFEAELLIADLELPAAVDGPTGDLGEMTVERLELPGRAAPHADPVEPRVASPLDDDAEVWQALVTGVRDYVRKSGFQSAVIGLSGGIDSAVTAALAVDALGPANVVTVSMPSSHSSQHSKDDAAELAKRTGVEYRVESIQKMVDAFLASMSLSGLAVENLQSRIRGVILMGLSNQEGHLVLATGNKSEYAVGYSTLYGDSVGGYAPLKDVPKTLVRRLALWRNAYAAKHNEAPPIPEHTIAKPPSAELRPGQLDTDSLPPYEVLDPILAGYIDHDLGLRELIAAGHDPQLTERVIRMVDTAEYKRRQSAPGPKISHKAFGRDRRLPLTNRYRENA